MESSMRVFVVGASGAIGRRLVPQLIERGHEVVGSARSAEKAERLRTLGAEPVVLDALDARAVRKAVAAAQPDAIVDQATAPTDLSDFRHVDRSFAQTNRLRTEGTDNLLAAAREAPQPLRRDRLRPTPNGSGRARDDSRNGGTNGQDPDRG
jgi:nucleoside-diphosphate-sugar epimerase